MIILIEGPRNSGKSYLINSVSRKTFKFPFDYWFDGLNIPNDSKEIHSFAISKEIMLHQLNREGHLGKEPITVDRGILSTWVWGILQNRVSREEVLSQIKLWIDKKLFDNTQIVVVVGSTITQDTRIKDAWDGTDSRAEKEIYDFILEPIVKSGIKVIQFVNNFDEESVLEFNSTINKCVES
jgi:hypothetical protein